MIITDLDKSLLNNERQITSYTKNVLEKCMQKGLVVVFATARPLRAVKIFYESIIPNAVICHSGAVVYINNKRYYTAGLELSNQRFEAAFRSRSAGVKPFVSSLARSYPRKRGSDLAPFVNKLFYKNGIKSIIAKNILKNIIKGYPKANLAIECNDEIYANFDLTVYWKETVYKKIDIENLPQENIDKIIIGLESIGNEISQIKKYLSKGLYLATSEGEIGIIMNKKATKWNGIKALLKHYKIKKKNAIAFGDDFMDIEMIEKCGIGIAMENGIEEVKAKAKYICGRNDVDGVSKWIEKNVLNNLQAEPVR